MYFKVVFENVNSDSDNFDLVVETANCTRWSAAKDWLSRTTAHVVLVQELHLVGDQVGEASQWGLRVGWKSMIVPAAPGIGLGTSGGVGIFVRDFLGCHDVAAREGPVLVPHRAAPAGVQIPGEVSILVVSAYLKDSEGLSEFNRGVVWKIGAARSSCPGRFILGAVFQVEPAGLAEGDLVSVLCANLVVPESQGTCAGTSKEERKREKAIKMTNKRRRVSVQLTYGVLSTINFRHCHYYISASV